jgi:CRISPR-associated endoribonuclease Cas6
MAKSGAYAAQGEGEALHNEPPIPDFNFEPLGKVYQNGVLIKQHTPNQTKLFAYLEFELNAPVELQEIGYYAGFGHFGSQGFGCVGVKL